MLTKRRARLSHALSRAHAMARDGNHTSGGASANTGGRKTSPDGRMDGCYRMAVGLGLLDKWAAKKRQGEKEVRSRWRRLKSLVP